MGVCVSPRAKLGFLSVSCIMGNFTPYLLLIGFDLLMSVSAKRPLQTLILNLLLSISTARQIYPEHFRFLFPFLWSLCSDFLSLSHLSQGSPSLTSMTVLLKNLLYSHHYLPSVWHFVAIVIKTVQITRLQRTNLH